ncbi:SRR1-domain-containing protein [Wolfiporia cocos MD-104 SS10]|uniref:SRR1-domain-containing protein n=1 Tax=Wolfiporia cocos (strain MD-104) TaxID=742152 RepID=A0A2H3J9N4_WOLCO|nr:SRR1-domain-containing protein [Wolfiporia cocos MD-104 SS10]
MDPSTSDASSQVPPTFNYADTFTPSRNRKKRRGRSDTAPTPPSVLLERARAELVASDWLRESKQLLCDALAALHIDAPRVLCLGLGRPAVTREARVQLAFLIAICDELSIERAKVSAYDPVFTNEDVSLLDALGISRLAEDKCAAYALEGPTIAFMPHCDLLLYENLLRANWSRARLPHLVLIANVLSEYADSVPARVLAVANPCVWRLTPHLASRPLPICSAHPTAFNSTAIQHMRPDSAEDLGRDWWELPPGPLQVDPAKVISIDPADGTRADGGDPGP